MTILLISCLIGSGLALLVWIIYCAFRVLPQENRQYLDRPPLGFRVVWPLILFIEHYIAVRISHEYLDKILVRLKVAGHEYTLMPRQFIAAKLVSAFAFCLLGIVLGFSLSPVFFVFALVFAVGGFFYPDLWLREVSVRRSKEILRTLPFYLDVITLAVEAGSNLTGGITQAVKKTSDSALRNEFSRVLRDIRSGRSRAEALRDFAQRAANPLVASVVASLIQAEKTGTSLGPILRSQANQLRTRRFQLAEKKAMEAPVKMLAPLVLFIFPTTSLVIGFILLSKAVQEGLITWKPLLWAYSWPG